MQNIAIYVLIFVIGGGLGAFGMNEYDAGQIATLSKTAANCENQKRVEAKIKKFNAPPTHVVPGKSFTPGLNP